MIGTGLVFGSVEGAENITHLDLSSTIIHCNKLLLQVDPSSVENDRIVFDHLCISRL